ITIDHRYAAGKPERLRDLAAELVASKPDVIVSLGGDVAPITRAATTTIPIVMIVSNDPVEAGLVTSMARPAGNLTGVTFVSSDLAAKRLEFVKDIAPRISRVGMLWNPDHVDPEYRETQKAARAHDPADASAASGSGDRVALERQHSSRRVAADRPALTVARLCYASRARRRAARSHIVGALREGGAQPRNGLPRTLPTSEVQQCGRTRSSRCGATGISSPWAGSPCPTASPPR